MLNRGQQKPKRFQKKKKKKQGLIWPIIIVLIECEH